MNRREFFKLSALGLLVGVGGSLVAAPPQTPQTPVWFVRPQKSVADLEAEYRAWVSGDHDDHDRVVLQMKKRLGAI